MSPSARRSIRQKASVSGTGLHTGVWTEATFLPAPAGQGIVFRRLDLAGRPEIPARLTEVDAVERRTAIGRGDSTIHTVEHLLAAVAAHEIDDITVELTGPEPPILDGSVQPYFEALAKAELALSRIRKGEDFAKVAREVSEDEATRSRGGRLPELGRGDRDPRFEAAVLALKPGDVSEAVETAEGFEILELLETRSVPVSFEQVREQIEERLLQQKRQAELQKLVNSLRAKAKIETFI